MKLTICLEHFKVTLQELIDMQNYTRTFNRMKNITQKYQSQMNLNMNTNKLVAGQGGAVNFSRHFFSQLQLQKARY